MSAIEAATREHALVTTRQRSPHREQAWQAILKVAAERVQFGVREVMAKAGVRGEYAAFKRLMDAWVKSGHLSGAGLYRLETKADRTPHVTVTGTPFAITGQLTIVIPRNEDGVWLAIRELGRTGREFTIDDIGMRIRGAVPRAFVADYLRRLAKGGFVEAAGSARAPCWCLTRAPVETPRLAQDGTPLRHAYLQDVVWKALEMSASAFICVEELIAAVAGEGLSLQAADVRDYIEHLVVSGHVLKREHRAYGACYRLHRYTGPMAPRVISAHFVWDPNKNCIFGEGQRVREVRR